MDVDAGSRVWRGGRQGRRDLLLAAALAVTTAAGMTASDVRDGWWALLGGAVVAVAVSGARSRPRIAVTLTTVPALLLSPVLWDSPLAVAVAVTSYLAGRRLAFDRSVLPPLSVVAATGAVAVLARRPDVATWLSLLASLLAVIVFPWLVGRTRRQHQELTDAGWERAQRLEREQNLIEEQARLRERARIAGDMHDSLGHELSLLALRAGGLEVAPDLAEEHRRAVAQVRADAARATQRLGAIVGVLRDDAEAASRLPVEETLQQLVDRAAASGVTVTLDETGELPAPGSALYRAAHRVVQESVTNATKHAPAAAVRVQVAEASTGVRVTVTNGPSAVEASPATVHGGSGLLGLRERLRLIGGTLTAGPTTDGGFEVAAWLPRTSPDTPPAADAAAGSLADNSHTAIEMDRVRRRARRSLALTVAVPVAAVIAATLGVTGYWAYEMSTTVVDAATFGSLRVGQDAQDVVGQLPPREVGWGPEAPQPLIPNGADCRYYRSGRHPFTAEPLYRLCLDDGTLVSKDVLAVPEGGASS